MRLGTAGLVIGRESSREQLVAELHEHGPVLLAAARIITLDRAEAEDLVQTTYEIALRQIDTLREPRALRAWLLKIQMREAFRTTRRLRRLVRLDSHVREIDMTAEDDGRHAEMREALSTLPRRIRAAVVLHHLAGLSVRETAETLGVSENPIKSQLKTGLARLREALRDD